MNVKQAGIFPAIVTGLIVGLSTIAANRFLERDDKTAEAVAELKQGLAVLSAQVASLAEQPYVRREEFEARPTGIEQRLGNIERQIQQQR